MCTGILVFDNHCNTLLHCYYVVTQLHIDILTFGIILSWPPSAQVIIPTLPNAEMLVRKVLLRVLVLLPYGKQWHVMFKDWTVCPWLGVREMMNAWITFPQGLGLRDRFWILGIAEIWRVLKGDSCSESRNNTKICKDNEEIYRLHGFVYGYVSTKSFETWSYLFEDGSKWVVPSHDAGLDIGIIWRGSIQTLLQLILNWLTLLAPTSMPRASLIWRSSLGQVCKVFILCSSSFWCKV